MTIEIFPHDWTPTTTWEEAQENNEALERIFPLAKDYIESVWAAAIDWSDGTVIPIDNLPMEEIRESIASSGGLAALATDLSTLVGLFPQYKSGTELYIIPGQTLFRGRFKRQPFDEATDDYRVINAAASLDATCPPASPGTSGLDPEIWYYVYADLEVATSYPSYKISPTPPSYEDGYGPGHPTEEAWRYIGCFRTGALPAADIMPFHRYDTGWYFWRNVTVGSDASNGGTWSQADLDPQARIELVSSGSWVDVLVDDWCPPTADIMNFCLSSEGNTDCMIRAKGDTEAYTGWNQLTDAYNTAMGVIPVNVIGQTAQAVESQKVGASQQYLYIPGFHEPLI